MYINARMSHLMGKPWFRVLQPYLRFHLGNETRADQIANVQTELPTCYKNRA